MGDNSGEEYFLYIPFSFREKLKKNVKSDYQEPPKCDSGRGGGEGFLPHDLTTVLNTFMQ